MLLAIEELGQEVSNIIASNITEQTFPHLTNFLKTANDNDWRLIVRSTGLEDTEKLSNAGGNVSIPNVDPQLIICAKAMGEVVASYLSTKSILQRLTSGDETLFGEPFTPVLIQRMIGETENKNNPSTGCVVYSEEVEGKTKDITSMQCSFGHNAGVVDNKVASDMCYVDVYNDVNCLIKIKTKRLAPSAQNFELIEVDNAEPHKISLEEEVICVVKKAARIIHDHYGYPVDIELAYVQNEKTIYLVQTRPIVNKKITDSPSYTLHPENFEQKISATTIISAGGCLQVLNSQDDFILANYLEEALDEYLNNSKNTQIVIVREDAGALSHAAAVFRDEAIAVVVVKEKEILKNWLEGEISLIVDVQRGFISKTDFASQNIQELISQGIVKEGWVSHPIPQKISISKTSDCTDFSINNEYPIKSMLELVENVKNADKETAIKALSIILYQIQNELVNKQDEAKHEIYFRSIAQNAMEKLENVFGYALSLTKQVERALDYPAYDLQRLYPINFLEAALFQEEDTNCVDVYSYQSIINEYEKNKDFITEKLIPKIENQEISFAILDDTSILKYAQVGVKKAFTDNLADKWILFVDNIASRATKEQLKELLSFATDLEMMTALVNIPFAAQTKQAGNTATEIFNNLYQSYSEDENFFSLLRQKNSFINSYNMSLWQNPNLFERELEHLNYNILDYVKSDSFTQMLQPENTNILSFLAAHAFMEKATQFVDSAVKTLKGSPKYTSKTTKVKNFKTIIHDYLDLLKPWGKLVPHGCLVGPSWIYDEGFYAKSLKIYYKEIKEWVNSGKTRKPIDLINYKLSSKAHRILYSNDLSPLYWANNKPILDITEAVNKKGSKEQIKQWQEITSFMESYDSLVTFNDDHFAKYPHTDLTIIFKQWLAFHYSKLKDAKKWPNLINNKEREWDINHKIKTYLNPDTPDFSDENVDMDALMAMQKSLPDLEEHAIELSNILYDEYKRNENTINKLSNITKQLIESTFHLVHDQNTFWGYFKSEEFLSFLNYDNKNILTSILAKNIMFLIYNYVEKQEGSYFDEQDHITATYDKLASLWNDQIMESFADVEHPMINLNIDLEVEVLERIFNTFSNDPYHLKPSENFNVQMYKFDYLGLDSLRMIMMKNIAITLN